MNDNTRLNALESGRKDANDSSLTVGDSVFCRGVYATVTGITEHAPGTHDASPIRNDWTAVEVVTGEGSRWQGVRKCPLCDVVNPQSEADHVFPCNPAATVSGYTPCACRDCTDIAISSDMSKPELCVECREAVCTPITPHNEGVQFCSTYECRRDDAYEGAWS